MKKIATVVILLTAFLPHAFAEEPLSLTWDELMPEGELERLEELWLTQGAQINHDSMYASAPAQFGTFNVVESLDGKRVKIPGFILPFEYGSAGAISEFLLVPYFGACVHMPPPPPNQIVYVTAETPIEVQGPWDPIWAVGKLTAKRHMNDLGNTAYTLELDSWEIYE